MDFVVRIWTPDSTKGDIKNVGIHPALQLKDLDETAFYVFIQKNPIMVPFLIKFSIKTCRSFDTHYVLL